MKNGNDTIVGFRLIWDKTVIKTMSRGTLENLCTLASTDILERGMDYSGNGSEGNQLSFTCLLTYLTLVCYIIPGSMRGDFLGDKLL